MSSLLKNLGVKKKKSPEQLVRAAAQALDDNNTESIAKRLSAMKEILYGEEDKDPVETKCKELSASLRQAALMPRLIEAMPSLPFETRKDLAQVFNNLVRKNHEGFAEYVAGTPSIVPMLVKFDDCKSFERLIDCHVISLYRLKRSQSLDAASKRLAR
jgi:calcium binding protein 39